MLTRRQFAKLLAGAAAYTALPSFVHSEERRLRIAMSADTLAGSNINDARAAYRVWAQEIIRGLGINRVSMAPDIFVPSSEMVEMIRAGAIDAFTITAWEYAKVEDLIDTDWLLVGDSVAAGLEYILIVHNDSPFKKLADLRGRQLMIQHNPHTLLLTAWLDVLQSNSGLGSADRFFATEVARDSLTQVVLPVFFRHADAAGVTRSAFATAVELNPQLGRDLRVIAASPKVIPSMFCFRRGCNLVDKQRFKESLAKSKSLPAVQQVVELYQSSGFAALPGSRMKDTLDLVHQYEHLRTRRDAGRQKGRPRTPQLQVDLAGSKGIPSEFSQAH